MQGEPESRPARARVNAVLVLRRPHRLEPLGEGLRITRTQPHAKPRLSTTSVSFISRHRSLRPRELACRDELEN